MLVENLGSAYMTVKAAHMVSKGYIRAWADEKKRVEVLDLGGGRSYPISYNRATVVSYVYDPNVVAHDLEQGYAKVESNGIPVINKLREGHLGLTAVERKALIAFLDMHLDRGRFANQSKTLAPAVILKTDGSHENAELNLGDLLFLSQYLPEVLRLSKLGIEDWPWRVEDRNGLSTGDGAVLLWCEPDGQEVCTISFPLSPTKLLVIGQPLTVGAPHPNLLLSKNSKRWIVGEVGTLNLKFATAD
jgi:hypothetical protein